MNNQTNLSITSLVIASSLILVSLFFSNNQKLHLEKEILWGIFRAIIQLSIVGYLLNFIFGLENPIFTSLLIMFMLINGAYNASKRGRDIKKSFIISFLSMFIGTIITLSVLILSGAIKYTPSQVIPISGMIISNSMIALGLCFNHLIISFKNKREEIETKLALGSDVFNSCNNIIKESIKTGMLPTIDSMKTLGIVALPGTMSGLILAGISPMQAVKFQLLVTFMMLSTTSISSFMCCYLSYKKFFNDRYQLL